MDVGCYSRLSRVCNHVVDRRRSVPPNDFLADVDDDVRLKERHIPHPRRNGARRSGARPCQTSFCCAAQLRQRLIRVARRSELIDRLHDEPMLAVVARVTIQMSGDMDKCIYILCESQRTVPQQPDLGSNSYDFCERNSVSLGIPSGPAKVRQPSNCAAPGPCSRPPVSRTFEPATAAVEAAFAA